MPTLITGHTKTTLPYRFYFLPALFLILIGLFDTGYLAWLHYKNYTDITFASFCALSKNINCDTVSQNPWSILLGLPLAYWGFFAYLASFVFMTTVWQPQPNILPLWFILCSLGAVYALASLVFSYISATEISAYCILCLVSHIINFALFFISWIVVRRFYGGFSLSMLGTGFRIILKSPLLKLGLLFLFLSFLSLRVLLPPYWEYTLPVPSDTVSSGMTQEGHPWIGAEYPQLVIHEYADYQCFQCGKMHQFLRKIIAENPDKIRLVHHHYPMDHEFNNIVVPEPFHIGSGKMAMLGIYAASKNKFWEMNDALYAIGREKKAFSTRSLADKTGIAIGELTAALQHPQIREALLYDIRQGMKLHITGTPSYVIDGKVYTGSIPAELLQKGLR